MWSEKGRRWVEGVEGEEVRSGKGMRREGERRKWEGEQGNEKLMKIHLSCSQRISGS